MELVILLVVIIGVLGWFVWSSGRQTSKLTSDSAVKHTIVEALDVNQDGQVDLKDAVAAAEVVVEKTKKTAARTKLVAKATAAKVKTAAKKVAAKKPKK